MYHQQILCNSNNKPEVGKASTHGLARPRAYPHFRRPQIRLFHPLFQQIPSFRQQQSLILPTLFYDILKKAQVFLFYNVVSQYDSILENTDLLFPQIQKIKFEKCEMIWNWFFLDK